MAKRNTLTKKDAEAIGIDMDNINPLVIPDNISPVIKANLIGKWKDSVGVKGLTSIDMPTATERQNAAVRERAEQA